MIVPFASRDEWLSLRKGRIGASQIGVLFDCHPHLSKYALWMVLSGRIPEPEVGGDRPEAGLRFERAAAEWIAEQEGWEVKPFPGYAVHDTIEGLGASPDFEILAVPRGLLEVKWSDWLVHKRQWGGEPPAHILIQLQAQLCVTGYSWGAVGCVVGGNERHVYRFERRPKIIAEIERRVDEFWQSIRDGREPPVDGSDSTAAAIKALYPGDDGDDEPVDMRGDNELPELCASYQAFAAQRKEAEGHEQVYRNAIMAKVGEHRTVFCDGWTIRRSVTAAKPDRPAEPGDVIKGRAASCRLNVKEYLG